MNKTPPDIAAGATPDLMARCRELAMPTWRCNASGAVVSPPQEPGLAGCWLGGSFVARMVLEAAARKTGDQQPALTEAAAGCWLILIEDRSPRGLRGIAVAMALSPAAFDAPWFRESCREAGLDAESVRKELRRYARHDEAGVRDAAAMLRWAAQDALRAEDDRMTIAGFTRQLTDGFETIDLLYSLGRSMSGLTRPEQFVQMACDRLHASMAFGWVGAWFGLEAKMAALTGSDLFHSGQVGFAWKDLKRSVEDALRRRLPEGCKPLILNEIAGTMLPNDGQVLVQPVMRGTRVIGVLMAGDKGGDDPQVSSYDIHLLEATGGYVGAFLDNALLYSDQQATFIGTLRALTAAIDAKDRYTCGHSERVALLSARLAEAWGLDKATAERLHICGLVHDVGKIGVPEMVLAKPGRLTPEEFEQIKLHPGIGHLILRDIPLLADILPAVLHHHERWDGKGYPHGLSGQQIPLYARIVGLADTFDAMSSTRSYRPAMERPQVLAELARCAGSQFDPDLVPAFLTIDLREYDEMVRKNMEEAASGTKQAA